MPYNKSYKKSSYSKYHKNAYSKSHYTKKVIDEEIKKKAGSYNYYTGVITPFNSTAVTEVNTEYTQLITLPLTPTTVNSIGYTAGTRNSNKIAICGYEINGQINTQGTVPSVANSTGRIVVTVQETNTIPVASLMTDVFQPLTKSLDQTMIKVLNDKFYTTDVSKTVCPVHIKRWFKEPMEMTYPFTSPGQSPQPPASQCLFIRNICNNVGGNTSLSGRVKIMYKCL